MNLGLGMDLDLGLGLGLGKGNETLDVEKEGLKVLAAAGHMTGLVRDSALHGQDNSRAVEADDNCLPAAMVEDLDGSQVVAVHASQAGEEEHSGLTLAVVEGVAGKSQYDYPRYHYHWSCRWSWSPLRSRNHWNGPIGAFPAVIRFQPSLRCV